MNQPHRLRILHVSDLHENGAREKAAWRRREVLGTEWDRNLDALRAGGPIDLVCFTGDLAQSGDAKEYEPLTEFLDELLGRLELPRERLFLVPGNHDVHRKTAERAWKALREKIGPDESEAFSRWMAGGNRAPRGMKKTLPDEILQRQAAYREWLRDALKREDLLPENSPHKRLGYRAKAPLGLPFDVHIIGLDSAWLAGDDSDSRKLWLTEDQVMRLVTDERGDPLPGFRLALMHHPLTDLADGEDCRRRLADHVDLLLRGHLHEPEPETWADPARKLRGLAAGCLYQSNRHPNACHVLTVTLDEQGRPQRYDVHFRSWSPRGRIWHDDTGLYREAPHGKLTWWVQTPPAESTIHPRVGDVFVGRKEELARIAQAMLPTSETPRPVAVCSLLGMPGVGKSYLADRFAHEQRERFPGGYVRLTLEPGETRTPEELRDVLLDSLKLPAGLDAWVNLRSRLQRPLTLLHLENVDSENLASAAADLVNHLQSCPIVVTGRHRALGAEAGWARVEVIPLDEATALLQLATEYREAHTPEESADFAQLVKALGYLPLAVHLAAGYLRARRSVNSFFDYLRRQGFQVGPVDKADPLLTAQRSRAILSNTFELSLSVLREELETALGQPKAGRVMSGLAALAHAPAAGVGIGLGIAMTGLTPEEFEELTVCAFRLCLLEDATEGRKALGWRLHPLLAEVIRAGSKDSAVLGRVTEWFVTRLPVGAPGHETEQGRNWREVHEEAASLASWLPEVPDAECARVERAGSVYAQHCGPFRAWMTFVKRCLAVAKSSKQQSDALWTLGNVALRAGELDEALEASQAKVRLDHADENERESTLARGLEADILQARGQLDEALHIRREEVLPVYERLGDARSRAVTLGKMADILEARGQLDEALRIRREEEIPVYERLGDVRSRAVTLGQVADILQARGHLDEALRIRREEVLPVFEQLGDVHSRAVTLEQVARILQTRGQLDEALRIRREEVLPVFERLGDVRSHAVTLGQVADILQAQGQLDEALRIRREEQLPVYERLGDVREHAFTLGRVADILQARGQLNEALRIRREEELPIYERLGDVRSRAVTLGQVADILQARGQLDEALRIRREEELPVFERLGDVRERALTLGRIADILQARGQLDEALRIRREEEIPVYERLGDVRERAVALGKMADILQARGQLDEALRIRCEEELPVFERLGDVRERAFTLGRVADILQARGQLDEALRIRREEVIPVYERLGDVRERAVAQGKVADILQARGQLNEALRIRREEELAVFERLGDVRSRAVTLGKMADILQAWGQLDEALRIRHEEQLPVYERLGLRRELLVGRANLAIAYLSRSQPGDRDLAAGLLRTALRDAREMRLPEAKQILELMQQTKLGE